jgi:hypothetical protein
MFANFDNSSRLSNSKYKRPRKTVQDRLTREEIIEKLEDYIEVENMATIPLKTHIRYFATITDDKGATSKKFRLGGWLMNNANHDKYIVLSNGAKHWTVQAKSAVFFRKKTYDEIKEEYEIIITELKKTIKKKDKDIGRLEKYIKDIKKRYSRRS